MSTPAVQEIDDSLYSRQRYVLGDQAMKAMAASNVFISGLGGLGIEIAKNIALAGIRSLTIHDQVNATIADLGTQFYLSEKTVNQNRAAASLEQLTSLNPYVKIQVSTENLNSIDLEYFAQFKCVILTESKLDTQIRINNYCHEHKIAFITADVRGIFSWTFVDFGAGFVVTDSNGERPSEIMVANISNAEHAVISCLEHHFHNLETGDVVQFSDLTGQGYERLNGNQYRVTVVDPYSFSIEVDSREFPNFERGKGLAVQIKIPIQVDFLSLEESLKKPELLFPDLGKFDNPWKSFLGIRALHSFQQTNGRLPGAWNKPDAEQLVALAKKYQAEHELGDDSHSPNLISALSFTAQGSLSCLTSFLGGTVAQEALKALSGKFLPIKQWLIIDAIELLPSNAFDSGFDASGFLPKGDRYDQLRICVGEAVCTKLRQTKLFMVGAGAIGCEMMKNYALLGVATTQDQGVIHLTDNDLIEKSNLNRQFLFRPNNIQEPKSSTAASAVLTMNPDLNIVSYLDKVGPQTQGKFSDEFLSSLDICVNALDNVEARLYMDMRAVANQRPLLESGTLATKGHVQVIVPFLTESYASQSDPRSNDIPFCTLKSFPNSIDHCIIWARDMAFEEFFVGKPRDIRLYHEAQNLAQRLQSKDMELLRCLPSVAKVLDQKPNNFEDCIAFARKFFEESYHNTILQLLKNFPLDHRMKDGSLFWALPRRAPTPLRFDSADQTHLDFIYYFAFLWAQVWHVNAYDDRQKIAQVAEQVQIEPFVPKENAEIETDEKAEKPKGKDDTIDEGSMEATIARVVKFFQENQDFRISPVDFEKDDDRNHHIDFINAAANLRARCYSIPEAPRLETKRIAGNITPAIATTTAAVAGLVSLELIKIRMGVPFESYRNTFMNLAISVFYLSEPGAAKKTQVTKKLAITLWDRWDVRGWAEFTLQNLFDYFKNKYHLTVTGVLQDSTMVYIPMPMYNKRLGTPLRNLLKDSSPEFANIVLNFADSKGNPVSGPPVRYYFAGGDPAVLTKVKKHKSSEKKSSKDKKSESKDKSKSKSKEGKSSSKDKKSEPKDKKEKKDKGDKKEKKHDDKEKHSGSKRKPVNEDPSPTKPKSKKPK